MKLLRAIRDKVQGRVPPGTARSSKWEHVRKVHLLTQPVCQFCGGKVKLEVHHIQPFHLNPELELDPKNLITLCESKDNGVNCHLLAGHLGNFKSFNKSARMDALDWRSKIAMRPGS